MSTNFRSRFAHARSASGVLKVGLVVAIAVGIGCSDLARNPTDVAFVGSRSNLANCGSMNFSAQQCASVQTAINMLKGSTSTICQDMGFAAQDRFDSNNYFYDPFTNNFGYSFYYLSPTIYLGWRAFQAGELTNTIAHEEDHYVVGSSEDTATAVGNGCATSL